MVTLADAVWDVVGGRAVLLSFLHLLVLECGWSCGAKNGGGMGHLYVYRQVEHFFTFSHFNSETLIFLRRHY